LAKGQVTGTPPVTTCTSSHHKQPPLRSLTRSVRRRAARSKHLGFQAGLLSRDIPSFCMRT
jgi:hypothetical protein